MDKAMKRHRIISLILSLLVLFNSPVYVSAHPNASEHYEEIEAVLFNDRFYSRSQSENIKRAVHMLEYATTLSIDQFGETNGTLLKGLRLWKVPGIPKDLSEINPSKSQTQLSAKNHRTYTHQGWKHNYANERNGDLAHSDVRRTIMLSTVNKVFSFSFFSGKLLFFDLGYSEQCNAFCALLYYIHIIGDYIEDCNPEDGSIDRFNGTTNGKKIPFAAYSKPDVFSELIECIPKIFPGQDCDVLLDEIKLLADQARSDVATSDGQIDSEDQFEKMSLHVQKLMDLLTGENGEYNYIHAYLENEKFFTSVFP